MFARYEPCSFRAMQTAPGLVWLRGGEAFAPEPLGIRDVLLGGDRIVHLGVVDGAALARAGPEVDHVDARGCTLWPGLIDVHEHLCGGSGEPGFARATPEIQARELVRAGITTVVGCLGTDTTTRTMAGLVGRTKALRDAGLAAWCWTGGYPVPPRTLTGSIRDDVMLIAEVVGAGEVAIADERASGAATGTLAVLAREAHVGGMLAGKAGLTHVHVGPDPDGLAALRELVDGHGVPASWLYPTHVERTEALFAEALAFAARGAFVDVDVWQGDLARWLHIWRRDGGPPDRLTASSDAGLTRPAILIDQVREAIRIAKAGLSVPDAHLLTGPYAPRATGHSGRAQPRGAPPRSPGTGQASPSQRKGVGLRKGRRQSPGSNL